ARSRGSMPISNLRYAFRSLARAPSFTLTVVLTLALGIGASTLIYSVIDGVLLKPLPYPEPGRIVRIFQVGEGQRARVNPSDPNFSDLKEQTHSFTAFAQYNVLTLPVVGGSEPVRGQVAYVSNEFFDALGVRPSIGRAFAPEELQQGGARAVLI